MILNLFKSRQSHSSSLVPQVAMQLWKRSVPIVISADVSELMENKTLKNQPKRNIVLSKTLKAQTILTKDAKSLLLHHLPIEPVKLRYNIYSWYEVSLI